jgi:hypothetical protein
MIIIATLFMTVFFANSNLFSMEKVEKTLEKDYKKHKSIAVKTDNAIAGAFFVSPDKLAIATQSGSCYVGPIDNPSEGVEAFSINNLIDIPGRTLQKVIYDAETKRVLAISSPYAISDNKINLTGGTKKKIHINQWLAILKLNGIFTCSAMKNIDFCDQIVTYVDPKFTFVSTYGINEDRYVVWVLDEKANVSQLYPKKDGYTIQNITFHSNKKLCIMALSKIIKPCMVNNFYNNNNKLISTSTIKAVKEKKLMLFSTIYSANSSKHWQQRWSRSESGNYLTFSPQADTFAYVSGPYLVIRQTENGEITTRVEIAGIMAKIASLSYNEEGTKVTVTDSVNRKNALYDITKKLWSYNDISNQRDCYKTVFNADKSVKAVIKPFEVVVYKEEQEKKL